MGNEPTYYKAIAAFPKQALEIRLLSMKDVRNLIGGTMTTTCVTALANGRVATAIVADDRHGFDFTTELMGMPLYGPVIVIAHDATGEPDSLTRPEIIKAANAMGFAAPASADELPNSLRYELLGFAGEHGPDWRKRLKEELRGGYRTIGALLEQALRELGDEWIDAVSVGVAQ